MLTGRTYLVTGSTDGERNYPPSLRVYKQLKALRMRDNPYHTKGMHKQAPEHMHMLAEAPVQA